MYAEIMITDSGSETSFFPSVEEGIEWSTERRSAPGKLTFKVLKDPLISFQEGAQVRLTVDGKPVFFGFVFTKKRDREGIISVTAYDQLRYLKNKDTCVYEGKTASQLLQMLSDDFHLNVGTLEDTRFIISSRVEDNTTLLDMVENALDLTLQNTAGPVGQALAISTQGDKGVYLNCNFYGYQDTMLLRDKGDRQYLENCLVEGRTDYIYGSGIGFFQNCEIRSWGGGWITAPATPKEQNYGFVFNECKFTYMDNSPREGDDGHPIALGRPWHNYPKVAILNSSYCDEMHPEGWPTTWNMEYAATSPDLHLYEYNNTGKRADMSQRAKWAGIKELTAEEAKAYTLEAVLGNVNEW